MNFHRFGKKICVDASFNFWSYVADKVIAKFKTIYVEAVFRKCSSN